MVWNCKPDNSGSDDDDDGSGDGDDDDDDEGEEEYGDDDGDVEDEIVNEEQDGNLYPKWCGIASLRFSPCSNHLRPDELNICKRLSINCGERGGLSK